MFRFRNGCPASFLFLCPTFRESGSGNRSTDIRRNLILRWVPLCQTKFQVPSIFIEANKECFIFIVVVQEWHKIQMYFKLRIFKYIESEIAKPAIFFLHIYTCRQYEALVNQYRKVYNRTAKLISENVTLWKILHLLF